MPQQGTQQHEHMATGRNKIKATELAWYWITHHIAFKQLTYVQPVLMLMS